MSTSFDVESKLATHWPPESWANVTIVLAVSGGCDSVALLRAMTAIRRGGPGRVCVTHVNHQLRAEADVDEAFVVDLCRQWHLPCDVGRVRVDQCPDGLEAAARTARYRYLEQAAERFGARYVATAHTADDQVETILHRVIRGTGIGGLSGMSRARRLGHATLIRPLLAIRRAELTTYLQGLGQAFREDSSNADMRFTRNRIRHELLPWLEEHIHPGVSDGVLRLGRLAAEAQSVIDRLVDDLLEHHVEVKGPGLVQIDMAGLAGQPPYLLRELLVAVWRRQAWPMQSMGFSQWDQLRDLATAVSADASPPRQIYPGNVLAEASGRQLRLARLPQD